MAFRTVEERVDRLEVQFGQFLTELALATRRADERHQEAEQRHQEAEKRQQDAERRHQEAHKRQQDAEERHRAAEQAAEERHRAAEQDAEERHRAAEQAAEARNRAAEERLARFEQDMRTSKRELDKKWGDLANKMGTIVEDILAPNLRRLAREHFGFPVIEDFMIRRTRRQQQAEVEFDTLVVSPDAVILGEAKSTPTLDSAEAFAAKARRFFDFFPEHQGKRLIAVYGSWAIPDAIVDRLTTLGIYAMRMGEDTMELANAAALEQR